MRRIDRSVRIALNTGVIFVFFTFFQPDPYASALPKSIPQSPSAPPVLGVPSPPTRNFGCQRQFMYQGKLMDCDSNLHPDAEKLRPIISDVPAAIAELDTYQLNRYSIRRLAYTSTMGLALAGIGTLIASQYFSGTQQVLVRNFTVIPGLLITGGSAVYGFSLLKVNEKHLTNAVEFYNQARPDNRIELQFSTGIRF